MEKIVEEAFDRMCILPPLDLTPAGGRRQQPKLRVSKASKKTITSFASNKQMGRAKG